MRVLLQARAEAKNLSNLIEPGIEASGSIGNLLEYGIEPADLEPYCLRVIARWPIVKRISIAPQGIIQWIYPRGASDATIGLNLLTDPDRKQDAAATRNTRELRLTGPYELREGGLGLTARFPVYRKDLRGNEEFWGFSVSVISFDTFLEYSFLKELESRGYRWALSSPRWRASPLPQVFPVNVPADPSPRIYAGSMDNLPKDPVIQELAFSQINWILQMEPVGGWNFLFNKWIVFAFSCLLGFLVSGLTTKILTQNRKLAREIGERKIAETKLHKLLAEKELLLREIHHRVKNNLAIVESIVSLESQRSEDPKYEQVFADLSKRIHSVALIHEKLYRGRDLDRIKAQSYVSDLVYFIFEGIGKTAAPPEVQVDDIDLTTKASLSVGLILTELCTNAAKYGQDGRISIHFTRSGTNLVLRVENDGPPPPEDFRSKGGLGLRLVDSLASQLDGTWNVELGPPVAFIIVFPSKDTTVPS